MGGGGRGVYFGDELSDKGESACKHWVCSKIWPVVFHWARVQSFSEAQLDFNSLVTLTFEEEEEFWSSSSSCSYY